MFHFLKAIRLIRLIPVYLSAVFGKWNWFVKWVNVIRDEIYQSVNPLTSAIRQSKNDSSQVMTRPVCPCKCLKTNAILVRSHLTHFQIGNSACSISWNPSLINLIPRRNLPVREMTDQCPCKWKTTNAILVKTHLTHFLSHERPKKERKRYSEGVHTCCKSTRQLKTCSARSFWKK